MLGRVPQDQRKIADQPRDRVFLPAFDCPHHEIGVRQLPRGCRCDPQFGAELVARIQANVGRKRPSSSASDDWTLVEPVFRKQRPKRSSDGEFIDLDDPRRLRRVEPLATQAPFDLGPGIVAAGPEVPESC